MVRKFGTWYTYYFEDIIRIARAIVVNLYTEKTTQDYAHLHKNTLTLPIQGHKQLHTAIYSRAGIYRAG